MHPSSSGLKHREERVISGELKPSASPFGVQEEEEEPEVLYDKVGNGFTMQEKICAGPLGSTGDAPYFNGTTAEPLLKGLQKGSLVPRPHPLMRKGVW